MWPSRQEALLIAFSMEAGTRERDMDTFKGELYEVLASMGGGKK